MKITAIVENTAFSDMFKCVHGLSFYIETPVHKILFDMGPDDTFYKNAETLGIKLQDVDIAFISHGHNDHGGALKLFCDVNKKAKIYVREDIFEKHYACDGKNEKDIGLDEDFKANERIVFVNDNLKIDDELFIFSSVKGRKYFSSANSTLFAEKNGVKVQDDFSHEQNLVITAENKTVLIGGCAHNGIVNVLDKSKELLGRDADVVVSGFHLMNPEKGRSESDEIVYGVANELLKHNSMYYTCHCTGLESYNRMKKAMKNRLEYIAAGQSIII
jgi:7,8-dihydropterin-6-yl-methyl-4-(beta-D-ribofuranosyl)aminobenzene 5'-phosphate synthase